MTFEKDTGICGVDLSDTCAIDAIDEETEQEVKMLPTNLSSVRVMIWGYAEEISHIRFHSVQQIKGLSFRYFRDFIAMLAYFQDIFIIIAILRECFRFVKSFMVT